MFEALIAVSSLAVLTALFFVARGQLKGQAHGDPHRPLVTVFVVVGGICCVAAVLLVLVTGRG